LIGGRQLQLVAPGARAPAQAAQLRACGQQQRKPEAEVDAVQPRRDEGAGGPALVVGLRDLRESRRRR
jgi:hypothetical protein